MKILRRTQFGNPVLRRSARELNHEEILSAKIQMLLANPIINMTIINPKIIRTYGRKASMWEGCVSFGGTKNFPYAQVPRYKKLRLQYMDENGRQHEHDFEGLHAHVLQHEVDHLRGILFVDRVEDTTSYVTTAEYTKRFAE